MNGTIARRVPVRLRTRVRAAVATALAVLVLSIAFTGLARPAPARAATAAAASAKLAKIRQVVWAFALRQKGKPYIWGGIGPRGFDCSGLLYKAYQAAGIALPRTTYAMLASARLVPIPRSAARRGDLAFYGSGHVEVYYGPSYTYGAAHTGTTIGFHKVSAYWRPTMYFRVRTLAAQGRAFS